ncbi:RNA-binding protein YlmH, contains S4-like domain [Alkalibacterium putridalgicola]|uniref:RNA-binding protein S4 n=1 Tax=Alkalibacterium putridalgicola TaxID=426703 RepID=A0A1H7VTQ5_9LACT|nr:RNA-binding protein [Alkalibacterium putridalgicola]GEK89880.1 RNA-binding protein S4 [Alkalibacterium putridalgicola]SEM12653.1 RNA-binding protein YlmH, contains S4-like domain [Alkalibacterium putridalgicola]
MEDLYQHFREDEKYFIDQVLDWVQQVEFQYSPYLSPFLDPREQYIVESIIGQHSEVKAEAFGGYEAAERKRLFLSPSYFEPSQDDFEITITEIRYPKKFAHLSHGKILGTLMGTGIKREMIGDIITDGEDWQFFADAAIMQYLLTSVTKIGNITIQLEEVPYTDILLPKDSWDERYEIVSSLRLDVVLANVFHISRQKSKELISSGKVKVNWNETERPDVVLGIHDVLSIRGYGRIRIEAIEGKTKKEKIRLKLGVLDRNR